MLRWNRAVARVGLAAGLAGLVTLTGCGQRQADPGARPDEPAAERALAVWAAFPVTASPRPLVLTGPVVIEPQGWFPYGDGKAAYAAGAIDLPARWPSGPATAGGFPVIGAKQAGALLVGQGNGQPEPSRLTVVGTQLSTAVFSTDRGPRRLPAWLFRFRNVTNPAAVLAVAPAARFAPPGVQQDAGLTAPEDRIERATRNQADGTLILHFSGAPAEPRACGADYAATAVESGTAVAVWIRELRRPGSEEAICAAIGAARTAAVQLGAPLGDRVVVSARTAAPVTAVAAGRR